MSDRKAELERKKAKLQAMRDEKRRKEEEKKKKEVEPVAAGPEVPSDLREETDRMLADLGIPPPADGTSTTPVRPSMLSSPEVTPISSKYGKSPKKITLTTSQVTQTNIPPREMVSYSKETQTILVEREDEDSDVLEGATAAARPASTHKMPHVEPTKPAETNEDARKPEPPKPPTVPELTEEEKMKILATDDFQRFMDRSTRLLERALCEGVDIFVDYAGYDDDEGKSGIGEGEKLKMNRQFFDERWSKHRIVTSLDWSTQHPELLLASYTYNEESPHEPDGVALIWNLKYKKTSPEYIFHCQSAVMSSCFAKFHPNLVIGGTYSGQIVLWDNRSNKKTPVQRTPLSAAAHTHPVYCLNVVGTQNAHNLISISNDGKMCSWSLDMLSQPQDSMELVHKNTRTVAVTSLSFISGDVNNFVVGSEEAAVYTASRHGSKAGINNMFEGHHGPITGVDCNSVPGQIDFSQYFITSSFDWTVKLWNVKEEKPLHSFEDNGDYVLDCCWSPIHPALFATADTMGRLDMWNLNNDTEVPSASTIVDANAAVNKCRWHQTGQSIALGDDLGRVHIYDVGETLAQPKQDEWSRMVHTLQDLQMNKAEDEEAALAPLR